VGAIPLAATFSLTFLVFFTAEKILINVNDVGIENNDDCDDTDDRSDAVGYCYT